MVTRILLNANEFLYQSKPTPENLCKFNKCSFKSKYLNLVNAYLFIFLSSLKGLLYVLINSRLVFEKSTSTKSRETIFLSHYFGGSIDFDDDTFFGKIPSIINEKHDVSIFYLLQNSGSSSNYFKTTSFLGMQIVTLSLTKRLSLYKRNLKLVGEVLFKSPVFAKANNLVDTLNIAIEQSSMRTLRTLLSTEMVLARISANYTKFLWFTLEGHPYERYLIARLREDFPEVKIFGYQNAPIVPAQLGLFKIIGDFGKDLSICTSGSVTLKYLRSNFPEISNNIIAVGSGKVLQPQNVILDHNKPMTVLFLPEGTSRAAYSMFDFAVQAQDSFPHIKMIFRTHPRTAHSVSIEIQECCKRNGIEFSQKTLHEDFSESSISIFRSSAAAIEGMLFGNLPFFLNIDSNEGLDPLSISNLRYPIANSVQGFHEVIREINSLASPTSYSSQQDFSAFAIEYFTPLSIPWSRLKA